MRQYKAKETSAYEAVNLVNGKRYIGITCGYVSQRKAKHSYCAKNGSQTIFHKAIRKYGIGSFIFTVLSTWADYGAAKDEEVRLIATLNPEYNSTAGGDGALGYRHTAENRRLASERNKGHPGYWKGKRLPPHVGELSRQRCLALPPQERKRILAMGPKSVSKRVICLEDLIEFESLKAAARFYGIADQSISEVCIGLKKRKTAGGKTFRFVGA